MQRPSITRISVGLVGLSWLVTGCASGVALTKDNRSSIQSVSVSRSVTKPTEMFYRGRREAILLGGLGVVGAAAAHATSKTPAAQIVARMAQSDIDLGRIVIEQFETELAASGLFRAIASEAADAQFVLGIRLFGLGQKFGSLSQLKPMLVVDASLRKQNGPVLWQKAVGVNNLSDATPSSTHEEYLADPELIRRAFTLAAQVAARELVKDVAAGQ